MDWIGLIPVYRDTPFKLFANPIHDEYYRSKRDKKNDQTLIYGRHIFISEIVNRKSKIVNLFHDTQTLQLTSLDR